MADKFAQVDWDDDWHTRITEANQENAALRQRVAELEGFLQIALGHSKCYCELCKTLSAEYWTPKEGGYGSSRIRTHHLCRADRTGAH
jgi:hypothetical protein